MKEHQADYSEFAWDGISFAVPSAWHPAVFKHTRLLTRLAFDDDFTNRMNIEWVRPRREKDITASQKRYDKAARAYNEDAQDTDVLEDLPDEWMGTVYTMPEEIRLATAFYLSRKEDLFAHVIIHFGKHDTHESPVRMLEKITESFSITGEGPVAWKLYDIDLQVPEGFTLIHTDIQTGRKLLGFQWNMRRFYVWYIGLADIALKKNPAEIWARDLVNTSRLIKGPVFYVDNDTSIAFRRPWYQRWGRLDEIARNCRNYSVRYVHDTERNRLIVYAFNYRDARDLEKLQTLRLH
jgi:hypothetical protein